MFWGWSESLFTVGGKYCLLNIVRDYWLQLKFIVLFVTWGLVCHSITNGGPGTDHWGTASL